MKSLLQLNKRFLKLILKFRKLTLQDKILIIKIFILTAIMRGVMLSISFKNIQKHIGELNKESSYYLSYNQQMIVKKISWNITRVSKYTPWESKCLVQSLVAQYLLYNKGIESTLYLGISRDNSSKFITIKNDDKKKNNKQPNYIAHSWIRCGQFFVTGGNGNDFAVVAKFKK